MKNETHDNDLGNVLRNDGVPVVDAFNKINLPLTSVAEIKKYMGPPPWACRVVYNEVFGGVLICQNPGEGNRLHYHPDADECWVILEGEWEWYIDGVGTQKVKVGDIVSVKKGTRHLIKCVGDEPAIRFAVTKPDVNHVYAEEGSHVV
jgi:quercetin dioxygenase-like cupin family protein